MIFTIGTHSEDFCVFLQSEYSMNRQQQTTPQLFSKCSIFMLEIKNTSFQFLTFPLFGSNFWRFLFQSKFFRSWGRSKNFTHFFWRNSNQRKSRFQIAMNVFCHCQCDSLLHLKGNVTSGVNTVLALLCCRLLRRSIAVELSRHWFGYGHLIFWLAIGSTDMPEKWLSGKRRVAPSVRRRIWSLWPFYWLL